MDISLPRFWNFLTIIALNIPCVPFSFSFPSRILAIPVFYFFLLCSVTSVDFLYFFFILFVFAFLGNFQFDILHDFDSLICMVETNFETLLSFEAQLL